MGGQFSTFFLPLNSSTAKAMQFASPHLPQFVWGNSLYIWKAFNAGIFFPF
jgi:hypothetical protein